MNGDPVAVPKYCSVSLPVPLDQPFTYALPPTLEARAAPGCRVLVPFGTRKLTGIILEIHGESPSQDSSGIREALRVLDDSPAIPPQLLKLGRWVAKYYCAPLGETLRAMTPLASDVRHGKVYSLSPTGHDLARQLHLATGEPDTESQMLDALQARPLSAAFLKRKFPPAERILSSLERQGLIIVENTARERDPLRAPADHLRVQFWQRPPAEAKKLPKIQREMLSFLELHPGSHRLNELEQRLNHASPAARALARAGLAVITEESPPKESFPVRIRHALNTRQQGVYAAICGALEQQRFQAFLLKGVTGSGKTEVYLNAIESTLAAGRGALMLVPEIGLTPAVGEQFRQRFGERMAILHSGFHDTERAQQWRRIHSGEATVVIATRSGVFAPVQNLGLVIVDEEHDHSYKQQETPRYHGRDVAVVRARDCGAVVVLGSATPSLESRYNAERGKYTLLELPERIEQRPLPEVVTVDMRQEFLETRKQDTFSRTLRDAVEERLTHGEQCMLLLNRRGYSSVVLCRSCGERVQCQNCSVALTYHKRDRRLLCHYCNFVERVPETCPKCGSEFIQFLGVGSERLETELHEAFPKARIARLDRDTTRGKRDYENILGAFRAGEYDLLVGTQMIAKGHDIPNVTLVGIVNADMGLNLPDFRAAETTFQLLTQAAGRAGRGNTPGIVVLQTLNPNHYSVRLAAAHNYDAFYQKEMEYRRFMAYPPLSAMANILVRGREEGQTQERCHALGRHLLPAPPGVRILGPAAAAVVRLKEDYRYQMLIKASSRKVLQQMLAAARAFALKDKWSPTALMIDVDPVSLL